MTDHWRVPSWRRVERRGPDGRVLDIVTMANARCVCGWTGPEFSLYEENGLRAVADFQGHAGSADG